MIATEIRRTISKNPKKKMDLAQQLLKFTFKAIQQAGPLTEDQKKKRLAESKAFWFGFLGLDAKGKPKKKVKKRGSRT